MTIKNMYPAWYRIVADRIEDGWSAHLLTFMFHPMRGNDTTIQRRQASLVEEAYGRLATRVHRRPASPAAIGGLPVWLCAPDFPVPKRDKKTLREVTINGGQHVHGFSVMPPRSRLDEDLADHFDRHKAIYVGHGALSRLHAERITDHSLFVFGYVTKCIIRGRARPDTILVLPRCNSEERSSLAAVGRDSSLYRATT